MSIHSLDETFARDALKPIGPGMDLDVHETFTSWQEVLPYLAEPWRQLVASNAWTPPSFPYLCRRGTYSIEKAQKLLGFEPHVGIDEGMKRTEQWLREERLV